RTRQGRRRRSPILDHTTSRSLTAFATATPRLESRVAKPDQLTQPSPSSRSLSARDHEEAPEQRCQNKSPKMTFLAAPDGTRLHYEIEGDGPALILHLGAGCDSELWRDRK